MLSILPCGCWSLHRSRSTRLSFSIVTHYCLTLKAQINSSNTCSSCTFPHPGTYEGISYLSDNGTGRFFSSLSRRLARCWSCVLNTLKPEGTLFDISISQLHSVWNTCSVDHYHQGTRTLKRKSQTLGFIDIICTALQSQRQKLSLFLWSQETLNETEIHKTINTSHYRMSSPQQNKLEFMKG